MMDYWSFGLLDCWSAGVLECWNSRNFMPGSDKPRPTRSLANSHRQQIETIQQMIFFFIRCPAYGGISIRWEKFFPSWSRIIASLHYSITPLLLLFSACDKAPKSSLTLPPFDSQAAYELLIKQCDFGPRVPG
ncbi:MAG: hypothetical protein ACREOI_27365, partial [bacterium]